MIDKKLISIITPVYNESENIDRYFARMDSVLSGLSEKYEFEYVITDNRSEDDTFSLLKERARKDPRVRVFRFSRNFGYQKSILTGYSQARGDAAIEFDADLQDPPELLPAFLEKWSSGQKIVYGIRTKRPEGPIITLMRKAFYRILNRLSEVSLPVDAGDFMLLDRCVLDRLKEVREHSLYIRGIVFSMGFDRVGVPYARAARVAGKSKFPLGKMISMALDGVISQSVVPLRIASYFGIAASAITMVLSLVYVVLFLFRIVFLPAGFTTTTLLILLSLSFNALFLGIIGEYVGRIYIQVKLKPMTIIDEIIN